MLKLYKYLYYGLYSWNLKKWGESDLPQWNAMFGVSFMMFLNISLFGLLFQFFGFNIFLQNTFNKILAIILMLVLFVINYFLFIYRNNYIGLVDEFKHEIPKKRRKNTIQIWLYVVLSFALPVIIALLLQD